MVDSPLPVMHWLRCHLAEFCVLLIWQLCYEQTPNVATLLVPLNVAGDFMRADHLLFW